MKPTLSLSPEPTRTTPNVSSSRADEPQAATLFANVGSAFGADQALEHHPFGSISPKHGNALKSMLLDSPGQSMVQDPLSLGVVPDQDMSGGTPLFGSLSAAAQEGNLEAVQALLAAGARVDQPDLNGSTALYWAAVEGHMDVAKALLAAGAMMENIRRTLSQYGTAVAFLQPLLGVTQAGKQRRSSGFLVRVNPQRHVVIQGGSEAECTDTEPLATYSSSEMQKILKHHIQMPDVAPYQGKDAPRRSTSNIDLGNVCRKVHASLARGGAVVKRWFVVQGRVVRRDPFTLATPVCLCVVLMAVGVWAVLWSANTEHDNRVKFALDTATNAARELKKTFDAATGPIAAMSTILDQDLNYTVSSAAFPVVARSLLARLVPSGSINALQLLPAGVIRDIIPLEGNERAVGLDTLDAPGRRGFALTSAATRSVLISGPYALVQGGVGGLIFYPIFQPNSTDLINRPYNHTPTRCPPTICTPDFWGFVTALYRWEKVFESSGLAGLVDAGYDYSLTQPFTYSSGDVVAYNVSDPRTLAGTVGLRGAVSVAISLPNNPDWTLYVHDQRGWDPVWLWPVLAAVIIISLLFSTLVYVAMASSRQHQWLLEAMLPSKVIQHLKNHDNFNESFDNVTILFSDIVSYTTMVSELAPGSVVKLLNELYSVYDALTDQFGLYKVETIGDAFMAVGGCPDRSADPVEAAARVAMLAQAMVECTRALKLEGGHCIQIRIGIHSGPVEAAVVGTKMPRYCLFGDTVNTASRMESNSQAMRIHLSDATAQLLKRSPERFRIVTRGEVDVKGKGVMRTHWLDPSIQRLPFVTTTERKSLDNPV